VEVIDTPIFDEKGKLLVNIGISSDISKRKTLEQELQYKNADLESAKTVAEEANLAKSVFLSRMSHELRTPLNAILGYAQLLEHGAPPLADAQLRRVKPIIKAGWYLLELINEILDLDAIQSGNLSLLPESLSMADVLLECEALVKVQADQQGIQLNFIPCDSSLTIYSDKTRIKQILLNLLSNAIKYNREHGTVTVKCTQTVEHSYISIDDTGEGMSPEQLKQIFKPFNRLGQETGAKQGTGIGLVVTKVLLEQMGGDLSVESTVGVGSEFCVKLLRNDRRINVRGEIE
jgi:signal transduction histidine kinase